MAAITSTVGSILKSSLILVTMDLVRPLRPNTPDRTLVLVGRVTTLIVTVVAVLWAPQIGKFGPVTPDQVGHARIPTLRPDLPSYSV